MTRSSTRSPGRSSDRRSIRADFRGQVLAALGRARRPSRGRGRAGALPGHGARAQAPGDRAPDPARRLGPGPPAGRRPQADRGGRPEPEPGPQAPRQQGPRARPSWSRTSGGPSAKGATPGAKQVIEQVRASLRRVSRRPARGRRWSSRTSAPVPQDLRRGAGRRPRHHAQRPGLVRPVALQRLRPEPRHRRRLPGDHRRHRRTAGSSPACSSRRARNASSSRPRGASSRRSRARSSTR